MILSFVLGSTGIQKKIFYNYISLHIKKKMQVHSEELKMNKIQGADNIEFKCDDNVSGTVNYYCIFLYRDSIQKDHYNIPLKLLMKGDNLHFKSLTITDQKNVCNEIISVCTDTDEEVRAPTYEKNIWSEDPFFIFKSPELLTDEKTIFYQEKGTNKYFLFLELKPSTWDTSGTSYTWSEDLSKLKITNYNNSCYSFAKWINDKKNEKKVSTGQKASIVALLATIAAAGSVAMARYKSSKQRKHHRVHKYLFDKKNPNYFVPLLTDTMMPTETEYQVAWNLYKKTMRIAIPRIQDHIVSNTEKLVTFLEKYADRLFPVPAWKNPLFLDNQAKLTTVVLYLNKKNKVSKAAVLFWEQFKKDKEISRHDFIVQLQT